MDNHGAAVADAGHGPAVVEGGERFEKSELDDFVNEDKTAGQNIGKLLAGVFLISFFLMSGVCLWMLGNSHNGHDPQAGIGTDADAGDEHH
jgi:hypothetical protein